MLTDKKRTNEQTELHQFRKEPSYDGDLSPLSRLNSSGQSVFKLESGNGNVDRQTNGQKNGQTNEWTELHPISKGT